ncbi:MAG TPA: hypothetical protein GXX51_12460 [Firmicutes bacterium]|nr:hypothetical protein [Bacillota bacterium]
MSGNDNDKELIINVDYYDLVYYSDELYDKARIDNFVRRCAEHGYDRLLWRLSVCGKSAYPTRVRTVFDAGPSERGNRLATILKMFDPLEYAISACRKYGLKIYPWITVLDDYYAEPGKAGNLASEFVLRNPGFCWVSRDQKTPFMGVLCYEYPEVMEHRLAEMKEVLEYDIDGLYLCTRSHAKHSSPVRQEDYFGFNQPFVEKYKQRYGIDILTQDYEKEKLYAIRGESLTNFLSRVKKLTSSKGIPLSVGIMRTPYACMNMYPMAKLELNWRKWVDEGIVDELIVCAGEDILDHGEEWLREVPAYFGRCREMGRKLQIWFRLFDWSNKYCNRDEDEIPTKPASVISDTVNLLRTMPIDGIAFHEALNIEAKGLWDAILGR